MIISDLAYLDDARQEALGKGQRSYSKSAVYTSLFPKEFKISTFWGKHARGLNISIAWSKYASSYDKSAFAEASAYSNGTNVAHSYAVAKAVSY